MLGVAKALGTKWVKNLITLPKTNSSHLKIGRAQKETIVFQPSIFRCKLLVSGRVFIFFKGNPVLIAYTPGSTNIAGWISGDFPEILFSIWIFFGGRMVAFSFSSKGLGVLGGFT